MQIKKLESAEAKAAREKRKKIWIGVIISAIMIASTASFALFSREESTSRQKYGSLVFNKQGELWQTSLNERKISTFYLPQETENISCEKCYLADLQHFLNKEIYFSIDSGISYSGINELERNLQDMTKRMQLSCLPEAENSSFCIQLNLPIKSCPEEVESISRYGVFELRQANATNATENNQSSTTKVLYSNRCVKIQAQNSQEFARAADKLIFELFGIKK